MQLRLSAPTAAQADELAQAVRRAWAWTLIDALTDALTEPPVDASAGDPVDLDVPLLDDVETTLHHLSSALTLGVIERQAGRLWMLHAAALADPASGATVVLVAPSGTGKSTAARTLARRWGYVTDETAGIAADGRVVPHPKPLSIVRPTTTVKAQVSPADAGLVRPEAAPWLAGIAIIERDGASPVATTPVRTAVALARLGEQTSYVARMERPLSFMASLIERAGGVRLARYREAAELEPLVAELMERA
ncbi:hypothetical protein GCM10009798_01060 [Nocardioides panacihumi]|uniref:AAA+ ATPase domain-containing protein n=1 Tax=Nocardioides panacihumi TaxID=400774 RepID=A0ABN2Q6S6_9ACTN